LKTRLVPGPFYLSSGIPRPEGHNVSPAQRKSAEPQGKPSLQQKTDLASSSGAGGQGATAAGGTPAPATDGTLFADEGTLSGDGFPSATGGATASTGGASSAAQGKASGTQAGFGGDQKDQKGSPAGGGSSIASTPIPELPQHYYRSRIGGSYYAEVDHYVIQGMSIAATEICVAGDELRTKGPLTITQIQTDHAKCRTSRSNDREREICPPEASRDVVIFQGPLASPIAYSVNTCREYDTSHCKVYARGTDREREYCRVNFKYEGVWDAGTIFQYKMHKFSGRHSPTSS
jgi:hypothetical protein